MVSLLDQVKLAHGPVAASKGLSLHGHSAWIAAIVHGDHVRLAQVLGHLVGNAIKFSGTIGEIKAPRSARWCPASHVALRDRRSGRRHSAERQADMFQLFNRAIKSTTRRFGGTGLGLCNCASGWSI